MCLSCTGLSSSATEAETSSQAKPFMFGFSAKEDNDTTLQTSTQEDGVQDEKLQQSTEVQRVLHEVFVGSSMTTTHVQQRTVICGLWQWPNFWWGRLMPLFKSAFKGSWGSPQAARNGGSLLEACLSAMRQVGDIASVKHSLTCRTVLSTGINV